MKLAFVAGALLAGLVAAPGTTNAAIVAVEALPSNPLAPLGKLTRTQFASPALKTLTTSSPRPASQKIRASFRPRLRAQDLQAIGLKKVSDVVAAGEAAMKVRFSDGSSFVVRKQGLLATAPVARLLVQAVLDTTRAPGGLVEGVTGRLTPAFMPALTAKFLTLAQSRLILAPKGLELQLSPLVDQIRAGTLRLDLEALELLSAMEILVLDPLEKYMIDMFDVQVMIEEIKALVVIQGADPYDTGAMGQTLQMGYFDDGSVSYTVFNHYHPAVGGNVPTHVGFSIDKRNGNKSGAEFEILYDENGNETGFQEIRDRDINDNGVNDTRDPELDTDGDGLKNDADKDDDGDGVPDGKDNFPQDKSRSIMWGKEFPLVHRFNEGYTDYFLSDQFLSLYSRFLANKLTLTDFTGQVRAQLTPLVLIRP